MILKFLDQEIVFENWSYRSDWKRWRRLFTDGYCSVYRISKNRYQVDFDIFDFFEIRELNEIFVNYNKGSNILNMSSKEAKKYVDNFLLKIPKLMAFK